jgi:hypothetical protein
MRIRLCTAVAAATLAAMASPALARRAGSGIPGCEQAVTNIPWGTTDTACVGGPPGPGGWNAGQGGPGERISEQGHKNWPNYPGKVSGHGSVAGDPGGPPLLGFPALGQPAR